MNTVILGVAMFTAVVLALVLVILAARSRLVASGNVDIEINGERTISVPAGDKLLQTLAAQDVFLASACGGGGTCTQCKCIVNEGGGSMLPTEETHFTRREARLGWRLSCQTPVKQDMKIRVPEEVFGVRQWDCTVESNPNVATFIKELTLRLPEGESVDFAPAAMCSWSAPRIGSSILISTSSRNTGGTGSDSSSSTWNRNVGTLSSAPIQWPTTRRRRGW